MPDPACSFGDAEGRGIHVLRDQNPEWADVARECSPCVPHETEPAAAISPSAIPDGRSA